MKLTPLHDKVLAKMIDLVGYERTTKGGLIMTDTQGDDAFIRPRWFKVVAVGPKQLDVKEGDYVLVEHGRWSRGIAGSASDKEEDKIFLVDNNGMLGVSDEHPSW